MQRGIRVLRLLGIVLAATIAASGKALATYNLNLYCPGAGQTFDTIKQPQVPADNNRPVARSILGAPRSVALGLASGDLRSPPRPGDLSTSGVFTIEQALDFNVLDRALFFSERSQIVLLGHRDPRYAGAPIP